MSKRFKSNIFLFVAAIVWGFAFVAQCDVSIGSGYFLAARSILGTIALIPVILIFERESLFTKKFLSTLKYGMITGVVLFIASYLQQEGINIDKVAGKAGFITGFYSVLVPVFAFIIWRKKTTYNVWIGAFLSIVGLYFLCMTDGYTSVGLSDTYLLADTHLTGLTASTIEANSRFFASEEDVPKHALTMGIGSIFKSKKIVVMASGKEKAEAVKTLLEGKIRTDCPATMLVLHRDCTLVCDEDAYSLVK